MVMFGSKQKPLIIHHAIPAAKYFEFDTYIYHIIYALLIAWNSLHKKREMFDLGIYQNLVPQHQNSLETDVRQKKLFT